MSGQRQQTFPRDLLRGDVASKKVFFEKYTIAHKIMKECKEKLLDAIMDAEPDRLIFLYGPTGVGKSTLRNHIVKIITEQMVQELSVDLERLPILSQTLRVPNPPAYFNWIDNYRHLLYAADEPLVEYKRLPPREEVPELTNAKLRSSRANSAALREAYENVLFHRRPVAVLLDEAQALTKAPATRLLDQLDVIKSIVSRTKVPHVLFGTYSLLPIRDLDAQVSRRSIDIHFSRYAGTKEDRTTFANIVRNLALAMPLEDAPDLDPHLDYLHEKSAGCVGILKSWLQRAYCRALRDQAGTLTANHLEKTALSEHKLMKLFREIVDGEKDLTVRQSDYEAGVSELFPKERSSKTSDAGTSALPGNKQQVNRRPGDRNPTRDPIGSMEQRSARVS